MIRFPRQHLADEPVARVEIAAKRAQDRGIGAAELEPQDDELVDLPPHMLPPGRRPGSSSPATPRTPAPSSAPAAPAGMDLPPLDGSGLDLGTVAQGGDSFDALTKGIG